MQPFLQQQSIGKFLTQQAPVSIISNNLQMLQRRIADACLRVGRDPAGVQLVAVSKSIAVETMAQAAAAGQFRFGESYLQESLGKIQHAEKWAGRAAEWHFIGPLQANKTTAIASHFLWVHGVDREKIAQRLSIARNAEMPPLQICVQINVSGESSKSGCDPANAAALCRAISNLPNVQLRGLMTIPAPSDDAESTRHAFRSLRKLADEIRAAGAVPPKQFDTLSMGMSDDFEIAIEEGATIVRIGSALFGARPT